MARTSRQAATWLVLGALAYSLAWLSASAQAATNVAVFNFQMTSETPDWRWLQKGLSDRIATDFVQDRGLSVVARDRMQMLAQKMNWVPEMATTDAARMKEIRKALKIEQLISGVYAVADGRIRITGQIVDVEGRMELARKEVEGPAEQVLDLQRQLSAELLAWFTKKEPAQILATLPVWTRSLPAAKALYEGMDLYDQGRYAEAWLKFRRASRKDPDYVEAAYWVGKMYYFMNRYEHARRAIERFVYLDTTHPRLGDAMVEYVHTYENSGASAEALLQMYENMGRRFPNAEVREGGVWGYFGTIEADDWFKFKSVQLFGQIGRRKEAALMTRPAMRDEEGRLGGSGSGAQFCITNVLQHHALTGDTFEPSILVETKWPRCRQAVLSFTPKASPLVRSLPEPTRILGEKRKNLDKQAIFDRGWVDIPMILMAPSGHVFEAARFYALAEGDAGRMGVAICLPGTYCRDDVHFEPPVSEDLSVACREGIQWASLPRTGLLLARCRISVKSPQSGPIVVTGVRVEPTLSRIVNPGAIDVQCQDSSRFRVHVDGALARWFPGLVGPLSPGEHTVRLSPAEGGTPYGDWETKVTVETGKVTPVVGRLPWQADSPWSSWKTSWVGMDYPGYDLRLHKQSSAPEIQADEGAVRLVWAYRGDLWSSASTNGETFSPPRKLNLPVSSGWLESRPRLLRDESGRFILTFLSDRDAQHRMLPYICWSRDFVHWSAPALIFDETAVDYSVIQDHRGRLIWVAADMWGGARIWVSRDGYRWEQAARLSPPHKGGIVKNVEILELENGQLEIYVVETVYVREQVGNHTRSRPQWYVLRYVAHDVETWSEPETLAGFTPPYGTYEECTLRAARGEAGPVVLTQLYTSPGIGCRMVVLAQDQAGAWRKWPETGSIMSGPYSFAFQPGRGYLITWVSGEGPEWWPHPNYGPYVLRGPRLDPLRLSQVDLPVPKQPERPPNYNPNRTTGVGADGRAVSTTVRTPPPKRQKPKKPTPMPEGVAIGKLTYRPVNSLYLFGSPSVHLDGREALEKARPDCGTVNTDAIVATIRRGGLAIALAVDSEKPGSQHFDVLRIDTTGRGDFRDAAIVPRSSLTRSSSGIFKYWFEQEGVQLTFGQRRVSAFVDVLYVDDVHKPHLQYLAGTCAEGLCRFGEKVHRVRLWDANCNLRVNDVAKVASGGGGVPLAEVGDFAYVYEKGKDGAESRGFYGHPILVDGRLWNLSFAEDTTEIRATHYEGPTGRVAVNKPFWRMWLLSEKSIVVLHGGREAIVAPVGRYRLQRYSERPSTLDARSEDLLTLEEKHFERDPLAVVDIAADKEAKVVIGSPLKGSLRITQEGDALHFEVDLTDVLGRPKPRMVGPRHNLWSPRVVITISEPSGRAVGRLEKDLYKARTEGWKIPTGFTGTFTATAEFASDTFEVQVDPATFTIQ